MSNIKAVSCGNFPEEHTIAGGRLYVNPGEGCDCGQMEATIGTYTSGLAAAESAAEEFGVPLDLLLAVGQVKTHWEYRGAEPTDQGDYGVMGLSELEVELAAGILGVAPESVQGDLETNIRAGAALLQLHYEESFGKARFAMSGGDLSDWGDVVRTWCGYRSPEARDVFARRTRRTLEQKGHTLDQSWRSKAIAPQQSSTFITDTYPFCFNQQGGDDYYCLAQDFVPAYSGNYTVNRTQNRGSTTDPVQPVLMVVIHTMQGHYDHTFDWFKDSTAKVSSHYLVSYEGDVGQAVCEKDEAYHIYSFVTDPRTGASIRSPLISVGIEHEGFSGTPPADHLGETQFPTLAEYDASAGLVRYLCDKYDIPRDREHIWGHVEHPGKSGHVDPCRGRDDPAPRDPTCCADWDWNYFMSLVAPEGNWCELGQRQLATKAPVRQVRLDSCDSGGGGGTIGGGGGRGLPGWPPNDDGSDDHQEGWEPVDGLGCALGIIGILRGIGVIHGSGQEWHARFVDLRGFRSHVLEVDPIGASLVDDYYKFSPEMFAIFLKNPILARQAVELVFDHTTDIIALENGGDWTMDKATRQKVEGVLGELSRMGSAGLKTYVNKVAGAVAGGHGSVAQAYVELGGHLPESKTTPTDVVLWQNSPNPFNPATEIRYFLPTKSHVELSIFDVQGKRVSVLVSKLQNQGDYRVTWNASGIASGVYFLRLVADDVVKTQRMVLLK